MEKKNKRLSKMMKRRWPIQLRVLSVVLALSMILTSSGMQVLAEELQSDPVATEKTVESESAAPEKEAAAEEEQQEEKSEPETAAVTETAAPETTAPETSAPETTAPETTAPETSAPETTAPETSAPETTAPETSAPETTAPETSAPETTASETSAPETTAPETSALETTAPETSAPETTAPETTAPETSAPETTAAPEQEQTEASTQVAETAAPEPSAAETEQTELAEAPAGNTEPETVVAEMTEEAAGSETETELLEESEEEEAETESTPDPMKIDQYIKKSSIEVVPTDGESYSIDGKTVAPGEQISVTLEFGKIDGLELKQELYYYIPASVSANTISESQKQKVLYQYSESNGEPLYDEVGTYTVDAAGKVTIKLDATYFNKNADEKNGKSLLNLLGGQFTFTGMLSYDLGIGSQSLTFGKAAPVEFTISDQEPEEETGVDTTGIIEDEIVEDEVGEDEIGISETISAAASASEINLADFISGMTITTKIDGKTYTYEYKKNADGSITSTLPDNVSIPSSASVTVVLTFNKITGVTEDTTLVYQIPTQIFSPVQPTYNGEMEDSSYGKSGTYEISSSGEIRINMYEDYLAKYRLSNGTTTLKNVAIGFSASFSDSVGAEPGTNDNVIQVGPLEVTIPFNYENYYADVEINKTSEIDPSNKVVHYTVTVNAPATNTKDAVNVSVTDTISATYSQIEHQNGSSYQNVCEDEKGNFNTSTGVWTIGTMAPGTTRTLTYDVKLASTFLSNHGTISNKAVVNYNTAGKKEASTGNSINNNLSIKKDNHSGSVSTKDGKTYLTYTLTVTAPSDNESVVTDIVVEDEFTKNANVIEGYQNFVADNGTAAANSDNTSLTWNIPSMEPGTTATLTYEAVIKDSIWKTESSGGVFSKEVNNQATVKVGDIPYSSAASISTIRKYWVEKNGEAVSSGDYANGFKFTITANSDEGGAPMNDNVISFTDTLTSGSNFYEYAGNIELKAYASASDTTTPVLEASIPIDSTILNSSGNSWTLNLTGDYAYLSGNYYYVLVYYIKPKDGVTLVNASFGNSVGLGVEGTSVQHKASWSGSSGTQLAIAKSYLGYLYSGTPQWQVAINFDIPEGAVGYDYPWSWQTDNGHKITEYEWYTKENLDGLTVEWENHGTLVRGVDYKLDYDLDESNIAREFYITFLKEIKGVDDDNRVLIKYSTHVDLKNSFRLVDDQTRYDSVTGELIEARNDTIGNIFTLKAYGLELTKAVYPRYHWYKELTKSASSYNANTRELTWTLVVNNGSNIKGDALITEQLPEGLSFVSAKITWYNSSYSTPTLGTITDENGNAVTDDTRTVLIPISGLYQITTEDVQWYDTDHEHGKVTISVTTKVNDDELLLGNGTCDFVNTATLTADGVDCTATAEYSIAKSELNKTYAYEKGNFVAYTINVNSEGKDLLQNASTITLVDEMGSGMRLATTAEKANRLTVTSNGKDITSQCVLYDNTNVEDDSQAESGEGTVENPKPHTFTLTIPDNVPVTITYYVAVDGMVGDDVELKNKVYYYGYSEDEGSSQDETVTLASWGSSSADPAFSIYKEDESGNALEGVTFTLYQVKLDSAGAPVIDSATGLPELEAVESKTTDASGTVKFEGVDDDYLYCYMETGSLAGYMENTQRYYLQFKHHTAAEAVIQNIKGTMHDAVLVVRNYKGTSYQIPVAKTINYSSNSDCTLPFSFTLKPKSGTSYTSDEYQDSFSEETVSITGTGETTFSTLYFNAAGTYEYTITENDTDATQIYTKDTDTCEVTLVVGEDHSGALCVESATFKKGEKTYDLTKKTPTFNNSYNATGSATLQATKVMIGRTNAIEEGEFTFNVIDTEYDEIVATGKTLESTGNNADIEFTPISYNQDDIGKTYTYVIHEVTDKTYVTYAPDVEVKVTVTDPDKNGQLNADVEYPANADGSVAESATFVNTYKATGSFTLTGTKVLTGNRSTPIQKDEFTFTVEEVDKNLPSSKAIDLDDDDLDMMALAADDTDDTTSDADSSESPATIKGTTAQGTIEDGNNTADIIFTTFEYTQDDIGIHEYVIRENIPEGAAKDPNITYASETILVKIEVKDDGKGTLTADIVEEPDDGIKFTNKYLATGSCTLAATKTLTGRTEVIRAGEFNFTVSDDKETEITTGTTVLGTSSGTAEAPSSTASVNFGEISYNQDDIGKIFTYVISEDNDHKAGIEYTAKPVTVSVKVDDDPDHPGQLITTVTYPNSKNAAEFTNGFNPKGDLSLTLKKEISGNRAAAMKAGDFTFDLYQVKSATDEVESDAEALSTASTLADGTVTFEPIEYNEEGTFYYVIREEKPEAAKKAENDVWYTEDGIYYTAEDVRVTVSVAKVGDVLQATVTSPSDYATKGITVTNEYRASGSTTFEAVKSLTGDRPTDVAETEFSFTVTQTGVEDTPAQSGTDNGDEFEIDGGEDDLDDDNPDGDLDDDDDSASGDVSGDQISVLSVEDGQDDGQNTDKVVTTGTTKTGGTVEFGSISYTQKDIGKTFTYEITEDIPKGAVKEEGTGYYVYNHVRYSAAPVTVTVAVSDGGNGNLNVVTTYQTENLTVDPNDTTKKIPVFTNEYLATGSITLNATKTLDEDRTAEIAANEFEFTVVEELADGTTKDLSTVKTKEGGAIEINLNYTQDDRGDHTYRITEKNLHSSYINYTASPVEVTVNVAHHKDEEGNWDPDGTLDVTLTKVQTVITDDSGTETKTDVADKSITFVNHYLANGEVKLEATKVLAGNRKNAIQTNEFTFTVTQTDANGSNLTDADGNDVSDTGITGVAQADGSVRFSDNLKYDAADIGNTYYYMITEDIPTGATAVNDDSGNIIGYLYNNVIYTAEPVQMKVTITDDEKIETDDTGKAKLVTTAEYLTDTTTAVFTNKYQATGSVTLTGTKEVTYRAQKVTKDEFSFTVIEVDEEGNAISDAAVSQGSTLDTEEGSATAKIDFTTINYTQDDIGDHYYLITEDVPTGDGVTTDSDDGKTIKNHVKYTAEPVTVKVSVVDAGDGGTGELTATAVSYSKGDTTNGAKFVNEYVASGSTTLKAQKLLKETARAISADDFTFTLKKVGSTDALGTATTTAGGAVEFAQLTYSQTDIGQTYEYEIKETGKDENLSFIDLDAPAVTATVEITDAGDGNLNIDVTYSNDTVVTGSDGSEETVAKFENQYHATGTKGLEITKELIGNRAQAITKDEFTFTVYEVPVAASVETGADAAEAGTIVATGYTENGSTQQNGTQTSAVTFTTTAGKAYFEYTQSNVGTHKYVIVEDEISDTTITTVQDIVTAIVTVTDNQDGTLATSISYPDGQKIVNAYHASGNITLEAQKRLTGRTNPTTAKENEFSFTLKEVDENGDVIVDQDDNEAVVRTAATVEGGKVTFQQIDYTQDDIGDHYYKIWEDLPEDYDPDAKDNVMTYVTEPVKVKVTVSDLGGGKLDAVPVYNDDADAKAAEFTNNYHATGEIELEAVKEITGNRAAKIGDGEFTFTVTDEEGKTVAEGSTLAAGEGIAEGTVDFNPITYDETEVGPHTYLISENQPENPNSWTGYVANPVYAVVTVTDNGNGTLATSVKYYQVKETDTDTPALGEELESVVFVNDYYANGAITLKAVKELTGNRAEQIGADEFTFSVTENGKEVATGTTLAGGTVQFTEITYTQDEIGTHTYVISENQPEEPDPSIGYVAEPVTITVEVSDEGEGQLKAEVTSSNYDQETGATFVNDYYADGSITLTAVKELKGNRAEEIREDEFTFTVTEGTTEVATGRTLAGGQIEFTTIPYTQDEIGTHTYLICENAGEDVTIGYVAEPVTVTVEVTDAGHGDLNAVVTDPQDYEETGVKFVNQYHADGKIQLAATKVLTGNRAEPIQAGEFTFTVTEDGTEVATGETMVGGVVKFTEIAYDQDDVGTHTYVISENAGKDASIAYTAEPITVTVTVSDLGGGKLDASAAYPEGGAMFVNEYHASGSAELTAVKELTGNRTAQIQAEEFTFSVTEDDTEVATGATLDGGTVKFTEITYTQEDIGTHTYVISENAGDNESISYTAEPVTVTIEVTDAGAGKLNTVIRYPDGGAKFVNEYHANGSLELSASKELAGSPLQDGQFTFELKDADGNVLQTKSNDGDGRIAFDALAYTEADIDQVYTYTVSEVDSGVHGITYSTEVYTVQVTVKDNSDGTLTPETEITLDGQTVTEMSFENVFGGTVSLLKIGPDGEHLKNAKFELYQKTEDGWVLYTEDYEDGIYTTGEEGLLEVKNLSENEYYFIEATAPEGYITSKEPDGSVSKYTFKIGLNDPDAVVDAQFEIPNDKTSVEILKQDENGKAVAGAVLRVVDADGNKMDEWTTDGKAHAIVGVLTGGETYRLVEISAPKGHRIAQDITFTVKTDGPTDPVTMVDETVVLSETGSAQITKRLTMNGEPLAAEDTTFYAALFEDAECTRRVTEIKPIEFKNSSSASVTFENLESGKKYYLSETDANGTAQLSGMLGTEDFYLAEYAQGQELTVNKAETSELSFENQFARLPEQGFYLEGVLTVTKQLLGADGEALESDETFYVGIFDDASFETLSTSVYQNIVPISLAGASEASVTIPVVMPPSGEITLYVTEVDETGSPVADLVDFGYEVMLSETEVTLTRTLYAGEVVIVNSEIPEPETEPETEIMVQTEPETESETETMAQTESETETMEQTEPETKQETEPKTTTQTEAAKSVKTGDDTPTELYVLLFAAAAVTLLIEEKRRRGRKA